MKGRSRRFMAMLLACSMSFGLLFSGNAFAAENDGTETGAIAQAEAADNLDAAADGSLTESDIENISAAAAYIREQMTQRETVITGSFVISDMENMDSVFKTLADQIFICTSESDEGDYLKQHNGGMSWNYEAAFDGSTTTFSYELRTSYYTTLEQEQEVADRIGEVLADLSLVGLSDYEKAKKIYDYIAINVSYDYEHLGDSSYMLSHTAYAALIQETAVCQGYASLFYRMAHEAGLSVRIVTGSVDGEAHAWNMVKIGDLYYYVDTTHASSSGNRDDYFLKGSISFADRQLDSDYLSADFTSEFPMSEFDYSDDSGNTEVSSGELTSSIQWCVKSSTDEEGKTTYYLELQGNGEIPDYAQNDELPWEEWRDEITVVTVGSDITKIGSYVFANMDALTTVQIANTVTALGDGAFYNCGKLTNLQIPDSVTSFGNFVIGGTYGKTQWEYNPVEKKLTVTGNGAMGEPYVEGSTTEKNASRVPWNRYRDQIEEVVIEEGVVNLSTYALHGMTSLTAVTLPSTLEEIGEGSFESCTALTYICIPDSVKTIGHYAFRYCEGLRSIHIPASVTSIGVRAFADCPYLHELYFYGDAPEFENQAIMDSEYITVYYDGSGWSDVKSLFEYLTFETWEPGEYDDSGTNVSDEGIKSQTSGKYGDDIEWNYDEESAVLTLSGKGEMGDPITIVTVDETTSTTTTSYSTNAVPWNPFNQQIKEVKISDGITSISRYAFWWLTQIESITIPDSVITVGQQSFVHCSKLQTVTFGEDLTTIGKEAFKDCTALKEIYISDKLASVEESAFTGCETLSDVYYEGSENEWGDIVIGEDNDPLINAEIHYNYGEEEPWVPDGAFSISKSGAWVSGKECALYGSYSAATPGNADAEASEIVWSSSDPSILDVSETIIDFNIADAENNHVSIQKSFTAKKAGTVTITATAPDGRSESITVDVEPELVAVGTEKLLTEKTKVTLFQVMIEEPDEEYLENFISKIEVEMISNIDIGGTANRAFDIIDSYYEVAEDGLTAKIIYELDPVWKGNIKFRANSPSGQTVEIALQGNGKGFSAIEDGWCIINTAFSFGYDENYKIPLSYYFDTYGVTFASAANGIYSSLFQNWGGSCFGLSLLAVAEYNGQIDLSNYFNNNGNTLNEYGFETVENWDFISSSGQNYSGNIYTLQGNNDIIEGIERAQISLYSSEIADAEVFKWDSDYSELLDYLNQDDAAPLIIGIVNLSHAIVTDTNLKPIEVEDGVYRVYCYNSNGPQLTNKLDNSSPLYLRDQTYIDFDTNTGRFYYYDGNSKRYDEYSFLSTRNIQFYEISGLGDEFFYGSYTFDDEHATNLFNAEELTVNQKSDDGTTEKIFSVSNGECILYKDSGEYYPFYEDEKLSNDLSAKKGYVLLPYGTYELDSKNEASIMSIQDDYIYAYNIDGEAKAIIDDSNIILENEGLTDANFAIDIQNMDGTVVATAEGTLDSSTDIYLKILTDGDGYYVEAETDSSVDKIETSFILDGTVVSENFHMTEDNYYYSDNGDGTHTKVSTIGDNTTIEPHTYQNGECIYCGAEEPEEHVHEYGTPEFKWSEDYTSCTMVFTCKDGDDQQSIECEVTDEVTDATCTENGKAVYTAKGTFDGKEYTDVKAVEIPASGHAYGTPEFNWSDDYQTCTAVFTCESCDDQQKIECDINGETTNPTCTEEGNTVYTATVSFADKEYTDTQEEVIPATGHTYEYTDNGDGTHTKVCTAGDDTATEPHTYQDGTCTYCGAEEPKEHVHEYGTPEFKWSEDYTTCTMVFTCKDGDDQQSIECEVTDEITDATCTENGKAVYTAKGTFESKEYTDVKEVEIPALGHAYGTPEFNWSDDYQTCTAVFTCESCDDQQEIECDITSETTNPTCTEDGKTVYAATVSFADKEYTDTQEEVITATGHIYEYTDNGDGTHTKVCTAGDDTATEPHTYQDGTCTYCGAEEPKEHVHEYGTPEFKWSEDYTSCTMVFTCKDGDDQQSIECEVTDEITDATCTESGKAVYTAKGTFDSKEYTDVKEVEIPASGHAYGTPEFNWSDDYQTCTAVFNCESCDDEQKIECDITSETTDPTCTEDGKTVYTSTVSFADKEYTDTQEEVITTTGHTYEYTDNGDGTHTKVCTAGDDTATEPHTYQDGICTYCGAEEPEGHTHKYGEAKFTWSDDYSSCTATFTCADGDDQQIVDCAVTVKDNGDGTVSYTALVEFNGKSYTAEQVVDIQDEPDEKPESGKPTESGDNNNSGISTDVNEGSSESKTSEESASNVQTGDDSILVLWSLLIASMISTGVIVLLIRRKYTK